MSVACGLIWVGRYGIFSNLMCVLCVQKKRRLQTQLSQTANEKERRELEMMIKEKVEVIKRLKERVQYCEEEIIKFESNVQDLNEMKDKGTVFSLHTIYYVMMMN